MRAGRAVVAQLLLRLDDPEQPVDDIVVQSATAAAAAAASRGRQLGRRLAVGPQVPGVPRPAVPYTDAGALRRGRAQQPQHRDHSHRGRHDGDGDERPAGVSAYLTRRRRRRRRRGERLIRCGRPHPTPRSGLGDHAAKNKTKHNLRRCKYANTRLVEMVKQE